MPRFFKRMVILFKAKFQRFNITAQACLIFGSIIVAAILVVSIL